jgi:RNA polymerase sigma factor (sigma-70 family)
MYQGARARLLWGVMTMHGSPGGPASSALYDVSTHAFRRWRAGEEAALDELVRVMSPVLWHVVRATGLDRETTEDVVQNTWVTLVGSADSVRDAQAITRWLCTTARREAWKVSRAAGRTRPVEDDVLDARMPVQTSPEAEVVADDENATLWAALGRLSERCQKLLRIVAWEPRPDYSVVASGLDMPIGSIGPTRRRCLDKLRVELGGVS